MSRPRYRVDWSDRPFPRIALAGKNGRPLADCKEEILTTAKGLVDHWREVARQVRALRASDVAE
jgi:hypothetical protein